MSIYVRELLFDLDKLDIITKCDILVGIQYLYATEQINYGAVYVLNKYLEGYSTHEISSIVDDTPENLTENITSTLALLEDRIQYFDEAIVQQGLRIYPKYRRRAEEMKNKCVRLSKEL